MAGVQIPAGPFFSLIFSNTVFDLGDELSKLTIFDGAESIGGNKVYLEDEHGAVFVDFGTNYKRMGLFFDEYLRPRSGRGIHDFLELGLVPPLRIYRNDVIPLDLDLGRLGECRVDAVFLSHAHMDHAGCIGLLELEIPVVCTPYTAAILKAIQDSGRTELPNQIVYAVLRERLQEDGRVFKSCHWKSMPAQGREFLLTTQPSAKLEQFWEKPAGARELLTKPLRTAAHVPIPFKCWEVDHSIYGAAAFGFETEDGWVIYTGDFRSHGKRQAETKRFVREASSLDVAALLIEGTRASRERAGEESEEEVLHNSLEAVEKEKNLVIADFQPRHIERLETFRKIAAESGRSLVITTRDAYLLEAVKSVDGVDRTRDVLIYQELKETKNTWERNILQKFEDRIVDPVDVAKNPDAYILSFSFWDMKNLLDIKPKSGTYVYSSSEAFTEEAEFDFLRLWEWLKLFNFRVIGFEIRQVNGDLKPFFQPGYHASGHASGPELLQVIETIAPRVLIPIHTENPEFFTKEVRGTKVLLPRNGQSFDLAKLK